MIILFSTRFIKPPTAGCGEQKVCFFQRKNDIDIYQVHTFGHSTQTAPKQHTSAHLHLRRQTLRCISINNFFLRGQISARMMTDVALMLLGKHRQSILSFIYVAIYAHGNA